MIRLLNRRFVVSLWLHTGFVFAILLGLAITGQCAPSSTAPNLSEMSIEDLMNVTVVTAGKKAEASSKTPAAVFVITHDDIARYGYRTLGQALKRISGFYTEYDYAYDYVGVRGYLPNNDLNRRVLVLVDGHKVNDYLYGQAPVNQDLPVDMRDLDRIEVVKGPGSALWGSEALLCVVNCITKSAAQMQGFNVSQDLGFRNGQHAAYGQVYPGGLEITGTLSELRSDGQNKIFFTEYNDPSNNNGIAQGLDGERVGRGFMNMKYKDLKLAYAHVDRVKDLPTAAWSAIFNEPGLSLGDERHYWELSYENQKPWARNGDLFCRVYRDNYDAAGNFNWWDNGVVRDMGIDVSRAYGSEARYSWDPTPRLSAIFGTEYVRNYRGSRRNFITSPDPQPRWQHSGNFDMVSYYSQMEWDVTSSLRIVAGDRFDDHSMFGGSWSPRLAAIYEKSPRTTLKLLYGKAMRMPSLDESFWTKQSDLQPEKINTSEFVWEQQMGQNAHLVTSVFGFEMYDLINQWISAVHSRGAETQYEYRLRNGGSGYLGVSYAKAHTTDPTQKLTSSPNWLATTGLSVPVFGEKAYLAGELRYVSRSWTNMWNVAPAYAVADLALTSNTLIKNGDISLEITNLFNTPHVVNARPDQYQDVMPQPDREIQFQISYNL